MPTAEERAQRVVDKIKLVMCGDKGDSRKTLKDLIVAEITDAERKAIESQANQAQVGHES